MSPQNKSQLNRRQLLQSMTAALAATVAAPALAQQPTGKAAPAAGAGKPPAPVNLHEFEPLARKRISAMAYDYIAGGAADEITLRRNRERFYALLLKPRALVDVSQLDTRTDLFGQSLDFPILLAPTAYHKLVHPQGELATVRGAGRAHATMVVSSFATTSIEDVAKTKATPLWFQLYVQPDRSFTRDLVQRAEAAGCKALVVTADTPVTPIRDRESRHNFALPAGMQLENLKDLLKSKNDASHRALAGIYSAVLDPKLTWDTVAWIRSFAKVPVLLKGIIAPEDARMAAAQGASGIIVSNHGGRNLDTTPATIEALPGAVEAVDGRIPVLMDGGVRRGTDVVKALALGAKAVLIGRPYLWALAVNGAEGVQSALDMLRTEFEASMALCGVTRISHIGPGVLWSGK